jgi:hypothetical protein
METLVFPYGTSALHIPPHRLGASRPALPNLPALWLWRAKPAYANAVASPYSSFISVWLMNHAG